ncbi:hypothetical protein [[Scytonema hofmanni] UTEX B 1581]|nr:hypothetical protein [[Scytonema hofmanni] UTEX B 1581]
MPEKQSFSMLNKGNAFTAQTEYSRKYFPITVLIALIFEEFWDANSSWDD